MAVLGITATTTMIFILEGTAGSCNASVDALFAYHRDHFVPVQPWRPPADSFVS